jgi:hypothetical protein
LSAGVSFAEGAWRTHARDVTVLLVDLSCARLVDAVSQRGDYLAEVGGTRTRRHVGEPGSQGGKRGGTHERTAAFFTSEISSYRRVRTFSVSVFSAASAAYGSGPLPVCRELALLLLVEVRETDNAVC